MKNSQDLRIAVVGAGVSGIVTAYLLQRRYPVTLYEKNKYLGGHTHTFVIKDGIDAVFYDKSMGMASEVFILFI